MHPECKDVLIVGGWSRGVPQSMIVKVPTLLSTQYIQCYGVVSCRSTVSLIPRSLGPIPCAGNETNATAVLFPVPYPLRWELENEASGM